MRVPFWRRTLLYIVTILFGICGIIAAIFWFIYFRNFDALVAILFGIFSFLSLLWFFTSNSESKTLASSESLEKREHKNIVDYIRLNAKPSAFDAKYPRNISLQLPNDQDDQGKILAPGTKIEDVFDQAAGHLLILGSPGAGKTYILRELFQTLFRRAEQDYIEPIPIEFNLSSWHGKQPLLIWLSEEAKLKYPHIIRLIEPCSEKGKLVLLLDGLDEVIKDNRAACIEVINQFRGEYPLVKTVICSRESEYVNSPIKLNPKYTTATLKPLKPVQITQYLRLIGKKASGLRAALQADATLLNLLETPLMLNIMIEIYDNAKMKNNSTKFLTNHRNYVFDTYIKRMFEEKRSRYYTEQRMLRGLIWLAHSMAETNHSEFYIERLQPNWVPSKIQRLRYTALVCSLLLLIYTSLLLFVALFDVKVLSFYLELITNTSNVFMWCCFSYAIIIWILTIIFTPLNIYYGKINFGLRFRRQRQRELYMHLWADKGRSALKSLIPKYISGSLVVIIMIFVCSIIFSLSNIWLEVSVYSIGISCIVSIMNIFVGNIDVDEIKLNSNIKNMFFKSAISSISIGIIAMLFTLLVAKITNLAFLNYTSILLNVGLAATLASGGIACIEHATLRYVLHCNDYIPWNYGRFFDYAKGLNFIERTPGGGYAFINILLRDYFASLAPQYFPVPTPPAPPEPTTSKAPT